MVGLHPVEHPDGLLHVLLGGLSRAGQAQNHRDPQVNAGVFQQGSGLEHLLGGDPLVDLFQQFIPAALHPQIGPGEAGLAQLNELFLALGHGAAGAGVDRHLAQMGEGRVQGLQNLQQVGLAHDNGVPVAEKDLIHVLRTVILPGHGNVLDDLLHGTHVKFLGLIHAAEGTLVVGAADGALEQIAAPLSWGPINLTFITHRDSSCPPRPGPPGK